MRKIIDSGYIVALATGNVGIEITEAEYNEILNLVRNKPTAESGYDYRLTADLTWERYELPIVEEEQTAYTEEQLAEMTTTELKAICTELNIPTSMNKSVMIELIMGRQRGESE